MDFYAHLLVVSFACCYLGCFLKLSSESLSGRLEYIVLFKLPIFLTSHYVQYATILVFIVISHNFALTLALTVFLGLVTAPLGLENAFRIKNSALRIRNSSLRIRNSAIRIRNSVLGIRNSALGIKKSALTNRKKR